MKQHVFRLKRGDDLYQSIQAYCKKQHIQAGYAAACVGCVTKACVRSADGVTVHTLEERLEIVSLTGTVSENRCHLHISFGREDLSVIGGHLNECCISATCEMFVRKLDGTVERKLDEAVTGLNLYAFL